MKEEDALAWAVEETTKWEDYHNIFRAISTKEIALKAITLYLQKMQEE